MNSLSLYRCFASINNLYAHSSAGHGISVPQWVWPFHLLLAHRRYQFSSTVEGLAKILFCQYSKDSYFSIKGHLPNQSSGCLPLFVYEQAISVLLLRSIGFVLVFSDVCLFLCHTTRHCCHCRWYVFINCYSKSHYLTVHSQPIQFNTYMWS